MQDDRNTRAEGEGAGRPLLARVARNVWARRTVALGVGLIGALGFLAAGLPLPWLLGPLFSALLVSLAGARLTSPGRIADILRGVLGVAIGASFTPELLGRVDEMALSLALLPLYVLAIGVVGYPYFRRLCGFDPPTAYYAAMPGGLQDMLVFGEEAGADVRALSLVHATRVAALVSALPFLLEGFYGATVAGAPQPGAPITALALDDLAVMLVCLFGGAWGAKRIGLFGASIVGPMIVSAAASLVGLLDQRPPVEAIIVVQLVLGVAIGAKYAGVTLGELRTVVAAALGFCVVLTLIAAGFEQLVVLLGLAPPLEALLAFAPGGQGEMVILALVVGADVAFVALHHVMRVVIVILGAPLVHGRLGRGRGSPSA